MVHGRCRHPHNAQEALELAERLNREMIGPAYSLASFAASMQGDMEKAFELSDRASATWIPERGTRRWPCTWTSVVSIITGPATT